MIAIDPEIAAAELLAAAEIVGPPVDLLALCERWPSLRVSFADLDGAGYLIDLGVQGSELLLRRRDSPRRQRYTLAHELGHWVLQGNQHALLTHTPHAIVERWCDRFAAALLMPAAWVTEALGMTADVETIAQMDAYFEVSRQAALLRVGELVPVDLALADPVGKGPMFAWSTSREQAGRLDWVAQDWLREQLKMADDLLRLSIDGIELQATRLNCSRWLVALSATAALRLWQGRVGQAHQATQ